MTAIAPDDPLPLVALRKPAALGGARRASEVRRGNDRLAYAVRLVTDDAVQQELVQVLVDADTAEPAAVIPLSSGGNVASVKLVPKVIKVGQSVITNELVSFLLCSLYAGRGLDSDSVLRRFSTTYYASQPDPFALVSCNESPLERMVNAKDIVTFRENALVFPFEEANLFRDDDDVWTGPDPLLPHAVNDQYWGERALRFLKKSGYTLREGSGQPVRFVAWQKGITEQARFTKLSTPLGDENGIIAVGVGGPHFKTSADPMVLAHELAHSVYFDVLPEAADQTEEKAISEGIPDCFAMAAMNDMQQEWENDPINNPPHLGYTDPALADYAPFSFWAGSYVDDAHLATPGYPNLWNPKKSWPLQWPTPLFRFTHWSGLRSLKTDYEEDSTLVGGPCRMLVTGGPSVVAAGPRAITAGGNTADALAFSSQGVDRQEGFKRLTRLMLFTLIEAKNHPTSFNDFIDVLAANAQGLALAEWGVGAQNYEEKVKRAFGEYGFGRGLENESLGNTAAKVNLLGVAAAANLIAAGSNFSRPIAGKLCSGDEDFFLVNEEAGVGDSIQFGALASGNAELEVRFFRHKACPLAETAPKTCAAGYQVYPPVDADGNSPETPPPPPFVFTGSSGGGCPPGAPCGGIHLRGSSETYPSHRATRVRSGPTAPLRAGA
ncbi:MAG: hypothetical protein IPI67_30320 [Myxococcales bacterium]|nr:hypothetical protein [Myxococcales bacterium]